MSNFDSFYLAERMKILISWQAFTNDFIEDKVNTAGPNFAFHKYHYKHDHHVLLCTSQSSDKRFEMLIKELNSSFKKHTIIGQYLGIDDAIDLREVKTKVENLLLNYKDDSIDIFFSPGNGIMQLTWYILHTTLGLKTRLLQLRRPEYSQKPEQPELFEIQIEQSSIPVSSTIKQLSLLHPKPNERFYRGESLIPVYQRALLAAQPYSVTVCITGESGTGKEGLARYIHENSIRAKKAFVALNCSALNDSLLESRLFGYKKGAFTGADRDTKGLIEEANGGTLFLDEIGDISAYMQQSLLRVLQEGEILPIGGKTQKVDVRFLFATNRNLQEMCEKGSFRWDLYYRISVIEIEIPPLRKWKIEERRKLFEWIVCQKASVYKHKSKLDVGQETLQLISEYTYPGNIREMENIIDNLFVFSKGVVGRNDLPKQFQKQNVATEYNTLELAEIQHIKEALNKAEGKKMNAAKIAGISLNTLKAKMHKYKIDY